MASNVKQLKTSHIDFTQCIICQQNNDMTLVQSPAASSLENLLKCIKQRADYGEYGFLLLNSKLNEYDIADFDDSNASWHRSCYQDATHKGNIDRARRRYEASVISKDVSVITCVKPGRPKFDQANTSDRTITETTCDRPEHFTRSAAIPYNKSLSCFFCNQDETKEQLHYASSFNTGSKIRQAVKLSNNNDWKVRMQSIHPDDVRAIDIRYDTNCYITHVLRQEKSTKTPSNDSSEKLITAEVEYFSLLQQIFSNGSIKPMNVLVDTYSGMMKLHGVQRTSISSQALKEKLKHNMCDVEFSRLHRNKPELVCSNTTKNASVSHASNEQTYREDTQKIYDCAKIVRKAILKTTENPWTFIGTLENEDDKVVPDIVYTLFRWIIEGAQTDLFVESKRQTTVHRTSMNLAQALMYETKSPKPIAYSVKHPDATFRHSSPKQENPYVISVGLNLHANTRSERLINYFHAQGISVDYSRVLRIETQLAQAVIKRMENTGGVYIPPKLKSGKMLFFAIDNIDFAEDTADGKNTLHGTMITAFQQEDELLPPIHDKLQLAAATSKALKIPSGSLTELQQCVIKGNPKPKSSAKYDFTIGQNEGLTQEHKKDDTMWLIARTTASKYLNQDENTCIPPWAGYHSLSCKDDRPITNVHVLPLVAAPANEWQTLVTVIMQAQHITTQVVGPDQKTLITLDMDLYARAVKLQNLKPDEFKGVVFRIGEFHTVLCTLRALGSMIENSGIDDAWIQSDLYGPTTARQILEGKHMKRAIDAHMITLQVLFNLLMAEVDAAPTNELKKAILDLGQACKEVDGRLVREANAALCNTDDVGDIQAKHLQLSKDRDSSSMFKVTKRYIDTVCSLLCFIKASHEGLWLLHLVSLEELCHVFFSQNRLKYAQHVPEYLAKMYELQQSAPDVWQTFLDGNFCIKKGLVPFTSIGVDHALEQENRKMKVMGGIGGITRNQSALTRFFLIAPETSRLAKEANSIANVHQLSTNQHHDLTQSVRVKQEEKIERLQQTISEANPLKYEGPDLVNFMTKSVLPPDVTNDIIQQHQRGLEAYQSFVSNRIIGPGHFWDPMKKLKLKSWNSTTKKVCSTAEGKVVELKENRNLFARMAIAARSRPDIDMAETIKNYELSTVSRSLFSADGSLLPCFDKHKLQNILECLPVNDERVDDNDDQTIENYALVVDGMVLVQQLATRQSDLRTCKDLLKEYIRCLEYRVKSYNSIHLVFDHYNVEKSLKQQTRDRRTGYTDSERYYLCMDSTPIRGPLKTFLAHPRTKASLVEYLAESILGHFKDQQLRIVISTENGVKSNCTNVDHLNCNHEEADTMIIVQAMDAFKDGRVVHILSPDTDVSILALRFFNDIGPNSAVYLGSGSQQRLVKLKPIYDVLGVEFADALPGFHSFTGSDTTGRFSGKGKITCWKVLKSHVEFVPAFSALGKTRELPPEALEHLEAFVCKLYQSGTKIRDVGELRWYLFKKSQLEAEKLRPTRDTLSQHILRAHFQALIWNDMKSDAQVSSPITYGWREVGNKYIPIITLKQPAPDGVIELIRCGCKVGMCKTNQCSCKKAGLVCTEMCKCEADPDLCANENVSVIENDNSDEDSE